MLIFKAKLYIYKNLLTRDSQLIIYLYINKKIFVFLINILPPDHS